MNLVEQRAFIQLLWGRCPHDEPLRYFWERQRELSWNRPAFLKVVMGVANKIFLAQFKDKRTLDKSFRSVVSRVKALPNSLWRRESFCSIKDFFGDGSPVTCSLLLKSLFPIISIASYLSWPKSFRDPPKGFIPLPDAEIGGCARNDSLIAPAI